MNLFSQVPHTLFEEEQVQVIHQDETCRIERILSCGQCSPDGFWYDQEENEWVTLIQGEAILNVEGKQVSLHPGDCIFLPKHQKHRVEYTSKSPICIWICVFYPEKGEEI